MKPFFAAPLALLVLSVGLLAASHRNGAEPALSDLHQVIARVMDRSGGAEEPPVTSRACDGDAAEMPALPNSIWCRPLPSSPRIAANSTAMVQFYAQGNVVNNNRPYFNQQFDVPFGPGFIYQFGAQDHGGAPQYATRSSMYKALRSDPLFTIVDAGQYGEQIVADTINIPLGALPQGGFGHGDEHHIGIFDPTGTYEYDFAGVSSMTEGIDGGPGTITARNVAKIPIATSSGFGCGHPYVNKTGPASNCTGGSTTSSSRLLSQGLILAQEIDQGAINHAIAIDFSCGTHTSIPPALGSDTQCRTKHLPGEKHGFDNVTNAMPTGQRIFIAACATYPTCTVAQSETTIASWPIPAPTKIIMNAMAAFGGYTIDTISNTGNTFYMEALDAHSYNGSHPFTDAWPALASKYGLAPYPGGTTQDYGYDLDFRDIPTNPNGAPGAKGWWSWIAMCDPSGC